MLHVQLRTLESRQLLSAIMRIAVATAVMGLAAYNTERLLHVSAGEAGTVARAFSVFGAIGVGVAVFAAAAYLLHIEEFRVLASRLTARR